MVEDSRRPVLSWPIIISGCAYAVIGLYLFNDFMRHVTSTEYVSVSSLEAPASPRIEVLPQSSYVPQQDDDVLIIVP